MLTRPAVTLLTVAMLCPAALWAAPVKLKTAATSVANERPPTAQCLRRMTQPVSRATAVQCLLSNKQAAARLRGKASPGSDLSSLELRTLAGTPVAAAAPLPTGGGDVPPEGLEGLDWAGGVHLSPTAEAPLYRGERRNYRCALLSISGVVSNHDFPLSDMLRWNVTRHRYQSFFTVDANLPGHSGLYVFNFRLSFADMRVYDAGRLSITAHLGNPRTARELTWWRTSGDEGFAAMLDIPAGTPPLEGTADAVLEARTTTVILSCDSQTRSIWFGGVTITRL